MKVDCYSLEQWKSGLTSAGLNSISSYKIYVNGIPISNNLPEIELIDGVLQMDVCEECFVPGCSTYGYVKPIFNDDIIIMKNLSDESMYRTLGFIYKNGPLYWDVRSFKELLSKFNVDFVEFSSSIQKDILISDALDIWLIRGTQSFTNNKAYEILPLSELDNKILTIYSDSLSDNICKRVFQEAAELIQKGNKSKLMKINDMSSKITVLFDNNSFSEWDSLFYDDGKILFDAGDGYCLSIEV